MTDTGETLDLVRSMRDSIRDFNCRAERQNASLRSTFNEGFICPLPADEESPEENTGSAGPLDLVPSLRAIEETDRRNS